MVFGQDLVRLERLANQGDTVGEAYSSVDVARYYADHGLMARSGGFDVFAAGVFANSVRMRGFHVTMVQQNKQA
jgi:hypothetical protein